ncbi:MAG: hypothetical protein ABW189_03230 [Rickettsiales bacterium]
MGGDDNDDNGGFWRFFCFPGGANAENTGEKVTHFSSIGEPLAGDGMVVSTQPPKSSVGVSDMGAFLSGNPSRHDLSAIGANNATSLTLPEPVHFNDPKTGFQPTTIKTPIRLTSLPNSQSSAPLSQGKLKKGDEKNGSDTDTSPETAPNEKEVNVDAPNDAASPPKTEHEKDGADSSTSTSFDQEKAVSASATSDSPSNASPTTTKAGKDGADSKTATDGNGPTKTKSGKRSATSSTPSSAEGGTTATRRLPKDPYLVGFFAEQAERNKRKAFLMGALNSGYILPQSPDAAMRTHQRNYSMPLLATTASSDPRQSSVPQGRMPPRPRPNTRNGIPTSPSNTNEGHPQSSPNKISSPSPPPNAHTMPPRNHRQHAQRGGFSHQRGGRPPQRGGFPPQRGGFPRPQTSKPSLPNWTCETDYSSRRYDGSYGTRKQLLCFDVSAGKQKKLMMQAVVSGFVLHNTVWQYIAGQYALPLHSPNESSLSTYDLSKNAPTVQLIHRHVSVPNNKTESEKTEVRLYIGRPIDVDNVSKPENALFFEQWNTHQDYAARTLAENSVTEPALIVHIGAALKKECVVKASTAQEFCSMAAQELEKLLGVSSS